LYESSQGDDINNWSAEDDGIVWDEDFDEDDGSGGSDVEDELFSTIENFIRTFHNGNYDVELDNALSFSRDVIPWLGPHRRHITSQITGEKGIEWEQNCIDSVTDQSKRIWLYSTHNSPLDQLGDDEEPIVWHDPIIDEYWDELKEAFDWRKQQDIITDISGIEIENVEMKK